MHLYQQRGIPTCSPTRKIRRLKPTPDKKTPDKYSDGNGLQLHVFHTGRMSWIFAYRFNGKQKNLTLGSYEFMSLAQARAKHLEAEVITR